MNRLLGSWGMPLGGARSNTVACMLKNWWGPPLQTPPVTPTGGAWRKNSRLLYHGTEDVQGKARHCTWDLLTVFLQYSLRSSTPWANDQSIAIYELTPPPHLCPRTTTQVGQSANVSPFARVRVGASRHYPTSLIDRPPIGAFNLRPRLV
jgi:hypothetical protein